MMLKIKDNVDSKELEKFGFKYNKENNTYEYVFYNDYSTQVLWIKYNKKIMIEEFEGEVGCLYEILEQLIQTGLAEKVVEE